MDWIYWIQSMFWWWWKKSVEKAARHADFWVEDGRDYSGDACAILDSAWLDAGIGMGFYWSVPVPASLVLWRTLWRRGEVENSARHDRIGASCPSARPHLLVVVDIPLLGVVSTFAYTIQRRHVFVTASSLLLLLCCHVDRLPGRRRLLF